MDEGWLAMTSQYFPNVFPIRVIMATTIPAKVRVIQKVISSREFEGIDIIGRANWKAVTSQFFFNNSWKSAKNHNVVVEKIVVKNRLL